MPTCCFTSRAKPFPLTHCSNADFLMSKEKIYRNIMDEEILVIKNAKLEYITTKTDNYNNELSYFKIKDKTILQKLEKYTEDPDIKLPIFASSKGKSKILKAKQKYVKVNNLPKNETITIELTLKGYEINDNRGFYVSSIK
jgi:hypothetical protein